MMPDCSERYPERQSIARVEACFYAGFCSLTSCILHASNRISASRRNPVALGRASQSMFDPFVGT